MRWIIRSEVADRVHAAWFSLSGIAVRAASEALQQEIQLRSIELRTRFRDPASALPAFTPARRMYHACGIDPSKTRPSSEALVRRILQGKGLYSANTAVDAGNLASLTVLRSIGLYDADRIAPEWVGDAGERPNRTAGIIHLRLGREGEEYPGIGKEMIHLAGRPAMVDRIGPFGNPSADSDRTKVTFETQRLLFVLFEPVGGSEEEVEERLSACREIMQRHVGGEPEE